MFSVKRAKLFLSLAVAFAGLGFFTLFAPIAQEARTAPAVATYQTETPYTSTSTSETVLTTTSTKTVDGFEDAVGDASPAAADITSVRFEKTGDFLKVTLKVSGETFETPSFDVATVIVLDIDRDEYGDFAIDLFLRESYLYRYLDKQTGRSEKVMDLKCDIDGNTWSTYVPISAIGGATEFNAWAITLLFPHRVEPIEGDHAPDLPVGYMRIVVYSESTRTVTLYPQTTLTLTSTYTTSSTYNSTYTVNVPVKQGIYIAPALFIAAVAAALAPLMLKPSAPPEPKPPAEESVKYCLECGAKLKAEAKFCDECGAKQE